MSRWRNRMPKLPSGSAATRYYNAAMLPDPICLRMGRNDHEQGPGYTVFKRGSTLDDLRETWFASEDRVAHALNRLSIPQATREGPTR